MKYIKKGILLFLIFTSTSLYAQDTLRIKVMTYNLRFGELASLEDMAAHIKAFNPDFVALQEVDFCTKRKRALHQNGKAFIAELGYFTGMLGLYGKAIDYEGGYYGIGILSKYPYISVKKTMLPWPEKSHEPRVLLEGLFEVGQDTLVFASTHLDVKLSETRREQTAFINDHFKQCRFPVVLGGDFNATPTSKEIRSSMLDNWFDATNEDNTIPAWNPTKKIDYLFTLPKVGWRIIRTQTIQSGLSDHLPIVTQLEFVKQ